MQDVDAELKRRSWVPELPVMKDVDDPFIHARYEAVMRDVKKKPTVKKTKKAWVSELPAMEDVDDPLIDAKYKAVLVRDKYEMNKDTTKGLTRA